MLNDPLPATLDVRKAAARDVTVKGVLKPQDLPRFRAMLAGDNGAVDAEMTFSRDEEMRCLVDLRVKAEVSVTCQRCLEQMTTQLAAENTLAIVSSDEQAAQLPRTLDPLVVVEQSCNLWDVVEEELILAMPAFNYHDSDACRETIAAFSEPEPEGEEGGKPNPFDVLAQLKSSDEH